MFESLKRGVVCALRFKKDISRKFFFCKIKNVLMELIFCGQTRQE